MENAKRLIDANALKEQIAKEIHTYWTNGTGGYYIAEDVIPDIDNAPTVDAVEVVHGNWVLVEYQSSPFGVDREYQCSICGTPVDDENYRTRYCPNCGAKMDGDGNV